MTVNPNPEYKITEEDKNDIKYGKILSQSLRIFFSNAIKITLKNPSQAYFFLKTVIWQKKAAKLRQYWESKGIHVPPIMIFSITNQCNLHCKGCYNQALRQSDQEELSNDRIKGIVSEAKELGISFIVLGGGEPLVRSEVINITKDFPELIFLIFTNGLLIKDEMLFRMKKQKNLVPIISLEGYQEDTDKRRGKGVYDNLQKIIKKLKNKGIFFGVSLTVTKSNFDTIINDQFVQKLASIGCKLFFFPEYTAIRGGTKDWVPTDDQRASIPGIINSFRSKYSSLFIAVPSDEKEFGGCLSAGRGFIHISAEGNLEPCPFAPYSDISLKNTPLKEALQSKFLKAIRQNKKELDETEGGCALWIRREWVQSLLE